MSTLTVIYALLLYAATVILIAGLGHTRINRYARTPLAAEDPHHPGTHHGAGGVVLRMLGEVVLFTSLFKANKPTWLFGWLFHFGLLIVLLGHLRYFIEPVWGWVAMAQRVGVYAGSIMLSGSRACGCGASSSIGYATSRRRRITSCSRCWRPSPRRVSPCAP